MATNNPRKIVHFVLSKKGGVGKSTYTILNYRNVFEPKNSFFTSPCEGSQHIFEFYDSDASNKTATSCINAEMLNIHSEQSDVDKGRVLNVLQMIADSNKLIHMIDCSGIVSEAVLEIFKDYKDEIKEMLLLFNIKVVFNIIISGGTSEAETIDFMDDFIHYFIKNEDSTDINQRVFYVGIVYSMKNKMNEEMFPSIFKRYKYYIENRIIESRKMQIEDKEEILSRFLKHGFDAKNNGLNGMSAIRILKTLRTELSFPFLHLLEEPETEKNLKKAIQNTKTEK